MTKDNRSARVDAEAHAIRAEYAEEEAEAAERDATLDVPLNLRIDRQLDARLKRQAAAAQIPTSALVRRLLRRALHDPRAPVNLKAPSCGSHGPTGGRCPTHPVTVVHMCSSITWRLTCPHPSHLRGTYTAS
ncbi:MAG: ribbon-helix-helix protein, CopG family [Nocardioidaceae bacterium]